VGGVSGKPYDTVFVTIYVDDLLILGEDEYALEVERALATKFKMTQLGDLRYLLGIEIDYVPGRILAFSQHKYIMQLLKKFGNLEMNSKDTPQAMTAEPARGPVHDKGVPPEYPYRSLVGALQYLVTGSRMDIGNAVRTLAKYSDTYTKAHWHMAVRVLKYLAGTVDHGLVYDLDQATRYKCLTVDGYCDADFANDKEDRKSITGYVTTLNGQLISARSTKQSNIATSTCHAEIIAGSMCAREIMWTNMMLEECNINVDKSTMYTDNHGAASLHQHPGSHNNSKHIEVRYLNVREYVEHNGMKILTIPTDDNFSDMLTKPLDKAKFLRFCNKLGIKDVNQALLEAHANRHESQSIRPWFARISGE
jgi:hypothetical protein